MGLPPALAATFDHSKTEFPLTGKHAGVDCKKCHINNTFKGTPTTCVKCHSEPKLHAGSKLGTDCVKCHTTTNWTGGTLGDFKHAFPVTHGGGGGKKVKACATCHKPADQFKTYTCYECHRHDSIETAKKHAKKGIANVDNCAKCHPLGKKGAKLVAADLDSDELFANCPADSCTVVSTIPAKNCPHDASALLTLGSGDRWNDLLAELPSRQTRTIPIVVLAPRSAFAPRIDERGGQPIVKTSGVGPVDWLVDPFGKVRESRPRLGTSEKAVR